MAKKGENRGPVTMKCTECNHYSRPTEKNKKNTTEKLSLKKYCSNCKKSTVHKESKN